MAIRLTVFAALLLFHAGVTSAHAAAPAVTLTADTTEIVVDRAASKATLIAANKIQSALGEILGGKVPIVRKPSADKASIILGTNAWNTAVGPSGTAAQGRLQDSDE